MSRRGSRDYYMEYPDNGASPDAAALPREEAREEESRPARPPDYRVLLADDHPIVRRGVRALLGSQPGISVCAEASNGVETLALAREHKPDLVLLDLTMPEMNGLETLQALRELTPPPHVLVLTMHFSDELARQVLQAGALGLVLKTDADTDLLSAVHSARQGRLFFTGQLVSSMARFFLAAEEAAAGDAADASALSPREKQVVSLLAGGKSNREAAGEMGVSPRTVESHRKHAMRKLALHSFSDLVRYAVRHGLAEG